MLAYSARNRSASIRIPHEANAKARRIEVRFPDSSGNPYLTYAALLLAGLDGIQNQICFYSAQNIFFTHIYVKQPSAKIHKH